MGKKRRESDHKLRLRSLRPQEQRDTLVTCPACGGQGFRLLATKVHMHRQVNCKWCAGSGYVEHQIERMFGRWLRIKSLNKC